MWFLWKTPEDETLSAGIEDWNLDSFYALSSVEQLVPMIEIFAVEYKRGSARGEESEARTSTAFRYASALRRDWHQHKHNILIAAGKKMKATNPDRGTLNEEVPAILQMLNARGEQRLREGNLVDTVSYKQNIITDAQVVAVVRFVMADGVLLYPTHSKSVTARTWVTSSSPRLATSATRLKAALNIEASYRRP